MSALRALERTVAWAAAGLATGLIAAIVVPLAFGARPYTVLSGSMQPAIAAGDLVVSERIAPTEARIGDVVTFQDPDDPERLLTHRVGGIRRDGEQVALVTKGDANTGVERWRTAPDAELGRVVYKVPLVGRVAALTRTRIGFLGIVVLPLLLLGVHELARIWRPETEETQGAAPT